MAYKDIILTHLPTKLAAVILNWQFKIIDRIIEKAYSFLNNKINENRILQT